MMASFLEIQVVLHFISTTLHISTHRNLVQIFLLTWPKEEILRFSQDSNLGPLNFGQMLLSTELLELNKKDLSQINTAIGSCGYFNLPIVRSQRQPILQHTLVCTYSLVLGLA